MEFKHLDVTGAFDMQHQQDAVMLDIRDPQSFKASHPENALHLTNETIQEIVADLDYDRVLLVMCYHGHSSQGAAQYLVNQGFETVYSIDGGFDAWKRANLPTTTS
ncbi:thiosulfate sulfurtransferase GlpE [Vibrio ulleungensis]|uniref:Thiosulfate sulfurtransferase GlpE n=1 Tax=Vibrio ulleungensis TaxID=2807619 RepID=A0ABS2HME5_9VIBR|nr:thiosulfate sulfurtransferase GlpE [Vibrio ulleungensis]MBM7038655.1 thiosulfate sulfurtransferase GlpE [Vibrio ulleungensis]